MWRTGPKNSNQSAKQVPVTVASSRKPDTPAKVICGRPTSLKSARRSDTCRRPFGFPKSEVKECSGAKNPQHPTFPSEACAFHARSGHALRQVFGLTGYLLTPASQFMAEPVLLMELSFLLTAAGQFRFFTGFPFKPDQEDQTPESTLNIEQSRDWGQCCALRRKQSLGIRT